MGDDIIYWTWSKPGESLLKSQKIVKENIQEEKEKEKEKEKETSEERFVEQNKRELNYNKIAARHLMTKGNINPFHIKNNYVEDISVQDNFLRPKDSNQE
jgi:hypothetical protein